MKSLRLAVVVFLLCFGLSALSSAQDQSLQYYQAGNTTYSQKNYDLAIRYYQAAAQLNPQMWQAYQGMGNCYYAKGDKASALTNYQKSLAINPNNTQLSPFVQSLQAQVGSTGTTTPADQNANPAASNASPAVGGPAKNFELEVGLGAGLASNVSTQGVGTDFGFGFGGRARVLYLLPDGHLGLGGTLGFYTFSKGLGSYGGQTVNENTSSLEISGTVKYRFDGTNLKPYGVACLGIASNSTNQSAGSQSSPSVSQTSPMIQIGGGAEFAAGNDMSIFGEVKYVMILVSGQNGAPGGTLSYIPLEAGLAFNL